MDYIAAGLTITGDTHFPDGRSNIGDMGGTIFSLEGIRLWTKDCLYLSKVGPDFSKYYGKWFSDNDLSLDGIEYSLPHTIYFLLKYYPDGQYDEGSIFGEEDEKLLMELSKITPQQVLKFCDGAKGMYLSSYLDSPDWDWGIPEIQAKGCKVMWEIPASVRDPSTHKRIWEGIEMADIYSLNLPESKILFGVDSEEEAIKKILEIGKPCYYRVGSRGSYMIMDGQVAFAPSIDIGKPVDPTGCGNCSTASALYCWCEGYDPLMIAVMSNISAAYNIMQYGPYPKFTDEITAKAHELAKEYYNTYKAQDLSRISL